MGPKLTFMLLILGILLLNSALASDFGMVAVTGRVVIDPEQAEVTAVDANEEEIPVGELEGDMLVNPYYMLFGFIPTKTLITEDVWWAFLASKQ